MTDDLDFELEFDDEAIIEENIFQFELTTYTSLIYNETQKIWYLQTDDDIENPIFIIEDEAEEIDYLEETEIFDYILTITDFKYFKEIVAIEIE